MTIDEKASVPVPGPVERHHPAGAHAHGPVPHAGRPRVLVLHGDQEIRTLIAISITLEGYEVTTAANAQDCLYKVRAVVPDVLITTSMNVSQPGECGTAAQLGLYLANSPVKVLLIDCALDPGEHSVASACPGACFDPAEMMRTVRNLAATCQPGPAQRQPRPRRSQATYPCRAVGGPQDTEPNCRENPMLTGPQC
jgi:CheY-like chemotaxis protein